uniref:Uncharacterized protein n=1 Tax=Meloidogyne enterolobii TaxID=390850 RepID=A0A6V7YCV3_MELEN|nr:unnamed protein product [Meloidogyne enterolobii]
MVLEVLLQLIRRGKRYGICFGKLITSMFFENKLSCSSSWFSNDMWRSQCNSWINYC